VPYRLPAASRTNGPRGLFPPGPLKLYSKVMFPAGVIWNTVPPSPVVVLPLKVTPYKLPVESMTRPPAGKVAPEDQSNVCKTEKLPAVSSL
jgi:hypothetical protein